MRLLAVLLALAISCAPLRADAAGLRVLASFLPIYLFARNVVGKVPGVSLDLMLPPSHGDPHDYSLTPGDMRKIAAADRFLVNGHGIEEFLGAPVRKANPRITVVETAAEVTPIRAASDKRGHGDVNPHTWLSPRNAILQVRSIERALSAASPANAAAFRRNADAYVTKLTVLAGELEDASRRFRSRNIVTFHNAFDYLARDLGLVVVGYVEETPGQEPSAGEIRKLLETIREKKAAVFSEPQYPARMAEVIAREAGVPVRVLDPVSTGSTDPGAYEEAMRRNLRTLLEALGTK